jgi:hypothetical protein
MKKHEAWIIVAVVVVVSLILLAKKQSAATCAQLRAYQLANPGWVPGCIG